MLKKPTNTIAKALVLQTFVAAVALGQSRLPVRTRTFLSEDGLAPIGNIASAEIEVGRIPGLYIS